MTIASRLVAGLLLAAAAAAHAQVRVDQPVAQQTTTAAYMTLTSAQGGRLVGASSPQAALVEVHEMKMEGDMMRMRAIPGLDLPAGQSVSLKPGGLHLMFTGLKQPARPGDVVTIHLVIEGAGGHRDTVDVQAPVRAAP